MTEDRPRSRSLPPVRGAALLLGLLAWAPEAGAIPPMTRADADARRTADRERMALVERIYQERLRAVPPDTFHPAADDGQRTVGTVAEDMVGLELTLRLIEPGGLENIDRIRSAALAWRTRNARSAIRGREVLKDKLRPSQDELDEAAHTTVPLAYVQAHPEERPTQPNSIGGGAAPPGTPSAPPLDYIPVPPEEMQALRERYLASGQPVSQTWYDRLYRDPAADEDWKRQRDAFELEVARVQTTHATEHGGSYQFGLWIQDVWHKKEPLGLALIGIFVVGALAAAALATRLLRRDR